MASVENGGGRRPEQLHKYKKCPSVLILTGNRQFKKPKPAFAVIYILNFVKITLPISNPNKLGFMSKYFCWMGHFPGY